MSSASDPQPKLKKTTGHWGRRKRRLRRVAWTLSAVAIVAVIGGYLIYRATRPEVRRPGEKLEDITERLSRGIPEEAPEPRFTDVTPEVGLGDFFTFVGDRSSQLPEDMGSGAAWGDYDNDGDDDLFLVGAGGNLTLPAEEWAPSVLFENQGDGTFQRSDDFPETRIIGMAAAWGDYDGDGWLDLVVTGYGSLLLFRNDQGRLSRVDALPDLESYFAGAAWGDFDNDRDLDLYVCGYVQYVEDTSDTRRAGQQYGTAVPYTLNPASFEPESNLLLQNNGDGTFTDVALLYGISNPGGRSLGALWQDFDADGWLDLYVANDISDNALFLNRQDTFEDVSLNALVADYRGAMGLTTGDWNRDGDDDLFVTHWIAQENALYDSRLVDFQNAPRDDDGTQAPLRLTFSDLAAPLGLGQIALHSVGWGTELADFDADGWLDLVVANGSTLENDQRPKGLKPQPEMLLWNQQGKYFYDLAPLNSVFATPHVSRGLALSDYDLDGDLDMLIVDLYEGVRLLRNDMQVGNWLEIRLRSLGPTGELTALGEGAKVTAQVGDVDLRRTAVGSSYLSQSTRTLHFGLGKASQVDAIEVRWLGGEAESFGSLEANSIWELVEGESTPRRIATPGSGADRSATSELSESTDISAMSERERVLAFWEKHRAGMDAFKIEQDIPKAAGFFAAALELNPKHEDARYYLANCLAVQGQIDEAMGHLEILMDINPLSHRAYKQWGVMRAMTAQSPDDLEAANRALERSHDINKEETGTVLVLGQIALMRGDEELAQQNLEWNTGTNPRSTGGYYLQGYLAWKRGDDEASVALLEKALGTRGEDWKPEGAVAEGDVAQRMYKEVSPLSIYWEQWDGTLDPETAFQSLDRYLGQNHPWS